MMRKPLQLHLIPSEFYPTSRPVSKNSACGVYLCVNRAHVPLLPWQSGAPPEGEVFVVGSMTQLAHYVYTDYQMRIDTLRAAALQKHKVIHNASMGAEVPLLSGVTTKACCALCHINYHNLGCKV